MKKIVLTESELIKLIQETISKDNKKGYGYEVLNKNGGTYNGKRYLAECIRPSKERMIFSEFLNEGIDFEPSENERGGIIVFSTDVNAIRMDNNKFINFFKQKIRTVVNRLRSTKKIDRVANDNELVGWTIGHYLDGRYTAKDGSTFGENSLSVEIIGVDFDKLLKIAEELCRTFTQESVLLKDFSSGRVLFVNPD